MLPAPGSLATVNVAAVRHDDVPHHREADTGASHVGRLGRAAAHEFAEYLALFRGRNAGAEIAHPDRHALLLDAPLDSTSGSPASL